MGRILEHWRIPAAAIFSVALIIGAYILARGIESPSVAQASAETALLQAIAAKDSDNDGLPDWEEALYGTNPNNSDSFNLGMTDGEAVARGLIVPKAIADISVATTSPDSSAAVDSSVPAAAAKGSITDTFAKNFFTLYLATKQANGGEALSQTQISKLVEQVISQLAANISPSSDFKSKEDIKTYGTGADALRSFAVQAEDVFRIQGVQLPKNELQYLQDAVSNSDSSALDNINKIAAAYRNSAAGLSALTVPEELSDTHLALVNALARLGEGSSDFARVNTDPIATMLALQQYMKSLSSMAQAFKDIASIYASEQIILPAGTPGASFVNVTSNVKLKASQKQL